MATLLQAKWRGPTTLKRAGMMHSKRVQGKPNETLTQDFSAEELLGMATWLVSITTKTIPCLSTTTRQMSSWRWMLTIEEMLMALTWVSASQKVCFLASVRPLVLCIEVTTSDLTPQCSQWETVLIYITCTCMVSNVSMVIVMSRRTPILMDATRCVLSPMTEKITLTMSHPPIVLLSNQLTPKVLERKKST